MRLLLFHEYPVEQLHVNVVERGARSAQVLEMALGMKVQGEFAQPLSSAESQQDTGQQHGGTGDLATTIQAEFKGIVKV